jgi:D-alanine-D-alanine ligase
MNEVILLVGGRSTEHDASVHSYRSVRACLRNSGRIAVPVTVFIDRRGRAVIHEGAPDPAELADGNPVEAGNLLTFLGSGAHLFSLLHGTEGEDGSWQGVADIFNLPGNFGTVDAAALGMNKFACASTVAALEPALSIPKTFAVRTCDAASDIQDACTGLSGQPCVVKPNSLGASLMTEFLASPDEELIAGLVARIAPHDRLALVQEHIRGDEITVGVVENENGLVVLPPARASFPGPILGHREKHAMNGGVVVDWPSPDSEPARLLTEVSARLFRKLGLRLWGRFDFIIRNRPQRVYFLEVNLFPGLGAGSIFPEMLRRAGWTLEDLVEASTGLSSGRSPSGKVLQYAIESHKIAGA